MVSNAERKARVRELARAVANSVLHGHVAAHEVVNNYARKGKGWYAFEQGLREVLGERYVTPADRVLDDPTRTSLVFVYGTLKRGNHNNRLLTSSTFITRAETVDKMGLMGSGVPFVFREPFVKDKSFLGHVVGEVYEVTRPVRDRLDQLEGHPTFYTRVPVRVRLSPSLQKIDAEMYLIERDSSHRIAHFQRPDHTGRLEWRP